MTYYLGIDFGTSGARAIAIDPSDRQIVAQGQYSFTKKNITDIKNWQIALFDLLAQIPLAIRQKIQAIAINGTSATVLLCNQFGQPIMPPLLYNDGCGVTEVEKIRSLAPPDHTVISATSSLAKLFWWLNNRENLLKSTDSLHFLHQADWLSFLLHGKLGISDYHNALKLGYDVVNLAYPDWLLKAISDNPLIINLPEIVAPGSPIGPIMTNIAAQFNLPQNCLIKAGTTDSIAAFIASGVNSPGEAVTSLGSTLVLKLLSQTRIAQANYGIYSHKLGNLWLVGGASNTGGAVLQQFFNDQELVTLSSQIDVTKPSNLDYYPLVKKGDRFPINDPNLPPKLTPRPANPVEFLHGLLESIARIEAQGYQLLQKLGANSLTKVYTAGGGAKNATWTTIRQGYLQVPVQRSPHTEAAYGTALLAMGQMIE